MPSGKVDAAVQRGKPGRDAGGCSSSSQEQVEQLCGQFSQVYPVNYNCPGQLVVSCSEQEKQALCEQVKALGGKAVELAVSGGFHSPFMSRAARADAGASLIGFDARSCDAGLCKQYSPSLP